MKTRYLRSYLMVLGVLASGVSMAQVTVPTYTQSTLPASNPSAPGSMVLLNDGVRGLSVDSGTQWVGLSGHVVNVQEFGATGGGIVNDGPAIRAAIQAAGIRKTTIFFPPGSYLVKPDGSNTYALGLASDIQLLGSGRAASVIKLDSNVGSSTRVFYGSDLTNVTIRDLSVDGNKAGNPSGTTNMDGIYLNNAADVTLRNVSFQNTVGNGVTLSGASNRIIVEGNFFNGSSRNGVFIRGGSNVLIAKNVFSNVVANAIQTAPVSGNNYDFSIIGNLIESTVTHGIKLSGVSVENPLVGVSIQANLLQGNGIDAIWTQSLDITGNEIVGSSGSVSPIFLSRDVLNARIIGNDIMGETASLLSIIAVSSLDFPQGITITGNTLTQRGAFPGLDLRGVSDINISANIIKGNGASSGISLYTTLPMASINVTGNIIKNFATGVLALKYSSNKVTGLVLTGNLLGDDQTVATQVKGIELSPTSSIFVDDLILAGNSMAAPVTNPLLINSGQQYQISGNKRAQAEFSGTGSPDGVVSAPVGSIYLRRDGGAATTLYVKETGVGSLGWVGK